MMKEFVGHLLHPIGGSNELRVVIDEVVVENKPDLGLLSILSRAADVQRCSEGLPILEAVGGVMNNLMQDIPEFRYPGEIWGHDATERGRPACINSSVFLPHTLCKK